MDHSVAPPRAKNNPNLVGQNSRARTTRRTEGRCSSPPKTRIRTGSLTSGYRGGTKRRRQIGVVGGSG